MSNADFKELLNRYLTDTLSVDELKELLIHLQKHENTGALRQAIQQALDNNTFSELSDKSRTDIIFSKIMQQAENDPSLTDTNDARKKVRSILPVWMQWTAAAAVMAAFVFGAFHFFIRERAVQPVVTEKKQAPAGDRSPGGNRAVLQLADGSIIALDDTANGMLAQQGNTKVLKLNNGQLSYQCDPQENAPILYNTISTPRGGQYHIILPDGSKVWLNAASSLRFPTAFAGKDRSVSLSGEAYFEIQRNKNLPFFVQVNDTKVEVLGTDFNVMGYTDEKTINTTLLAGKVKVSSGGSRSSILAPGQQAIIGRDAQLTVHDVDTESIIAWKNGMFHFKSDDIQTLMRQIERWYDVDVLYKGPIPTGHYSGTIARDNNLLKVLRVLEESSELKFVIEGRKLTVL